MKWQQSSCDLALKYFAAQIWRMNCKFTSFSEIMNSEGNIFGVQSCSDFKIASKLLWRKGKTRFNMNAFATLRSGCIIQKLVGGDFRQKLFLEFLFKCIRNESGIKHKCIDGINLMVLSWEISAFCT